MDKSSFQYRRDYSLIILLLLGALSFFGLGSCAHDDYAFVPNQNIVAANRDPRSVIYPIWSGPKEGTVAIMALGMTELKPKKETPAVRTLHLRVTLKNERDRGNFKLDIQEQRISLPGHPLVPPAYVYTDVMGMPILTILPHQQRVIDFFFPLPGNLKKGAQIPKFTFEWQVSSTDKRIAQKTQFDEINIGPDVPVVYPYEAYPYDFADGPGRGRHWWNNAKYPNLAPFFGE